VKRLAADRGRWMPFAPTQETIGNDDIWKRSVVGLVRAV
jgi:hypothetical protein